MLTTCPVVVYLADAVMLMCRSCIFRSVNICGKYARLRTSFLGPTMPLPLHSLRGHNCERLTGRGMATGWVQGHFLNDSIAKNPSQSKGIKVWE